MGKITACEIYEKYEDMEFGKFERVINKKSNRADLCALLMLDSWFPDDENIIIWAGHDEFYLSISEEQIETLSETQIIDLMRCGVVFDDKGLHMFA